jgi:hypothetical protein
MAMTKKERFADITRRSKLAHKEAERREKILDNYLNSNQVKKLRRYVQDGWDKVNALVAEWNDVVMEDHRKRKPERDYGPSNTYTSVDGELRLNYKEDPKSW